MVWIRAGIRHPWATPVAETMEPTSRWSQITSAIRGTASSRGATLVEYALVFSLLVVATLGSIEYLENQASDEIDNQADCVSTRPAPPECGFAPVPSEVSFPDPGYSPPTSAPPVAGSIPEFDASVSPGPQHALTPNGWEIWRTVELLMPTNTDPPSPPSPVAGIWVTAEVRQADPADADVWLPDRHQIQCQTDANGRCELRWTVWEDVPKADMRVTNVQHDPPPADLGSTAVYEPRPTP